MKLSCLALCVCLFSSVNMVSCSFDRGNVDDPGEAETKRPPNPGPIPKPPVGVLSGRVLAPDGKIPISSALVYVIPTPPAAIPNGVYCDKCVHIPDGTPYVNTKPDGSFQLTVGTGSFYLVVQKGAFRRVRPVAVAEGQQEIPVENTTLPAITEKAKGDDIPKIAVVLGAWDPIEVVLARMGLKATISKDLLGRARVLAKDAPAFAIYGPQGLGIPSPYPSPATLLTDPKEIEKYHIVFLPCSGGTDQSGSGPQCTGVFNTDGRVKTTLEGFVRKGGRVYVSDWSYEYIRQIFPGYVTWQGQNSTVGSACLGGGGEQGVSNLDTGLQAWLSAQGRSLSGVKDAWTQIASVQDQQDVDADGKMTKITPKVWVRAGNPVSVSAQHGCGRVLYTTYHTQPTGEVNKPLEEQALALLYLILEAAVCIDPQVIG